MWSLGLPSIRFAEAVNVTSFSDTLSDSAPATVSDHTISFVSPNAITTTEDIVITFDAGFDLTGIGVEDVDILVNGTNKPVAEWSFAILSQEITLTINTNDIATSATTTILIGTHATNEGSPDTQVLNPGVGAYSIDVAAGVNTGSTMVAIVDTVTVSAAVDTTFTFTVAGLPGGTAINGTTTTGSTTATTIPFGTLADGVASTTAQQLSVTTNAANGFVVTVQTDGGLLSTTGAEISSFIEGADTATPTTWQSPVPVVGSDNTYGHWGLTTNDSSIGVGLADDFADNQFVAASTTPVEVFRNDGPSDGATAHLGRTQVGYQVEISALQEAAEDYSATLTYVATPVF
jgi:hypothetical protein